MVKRKGRSEEKREDKKKKQQNIIYSDSEEEVEAEAQRAASRQAQKITSSLSRRVADGVLRRTAHLDGDLYIEVRVYRTAEYLKKPQAERRESATLALRFQTHSDAPEAEGLHAFIGAAKKKFRNEGTFFADKKMY